MPWKDGSLTRSEVAFAEAYARLGDRAKAEAEVGVTPGYGYKLLNRPEVLAEIRQREQVKLVTGLLPLSMEKAEETLRDPKTPAGARVQLIGKIWDQALGTKEDRGAAEMHEMTPEEQGRAVAEMISQLEAKAAALAKPVNTLDPFE